MDQFCQRNSIIHETTVPYLPQQNGLVERAIAIFFEMVRCMIHTASVDLRYWGEAFMYAVHIRRLTLTIGLSGRVPCEAWTGYKPDVSHLHIFGSLGWAYVPEEVRRGKLESRAVKVRMLGWWTDEAKGYRLEDLENGKLIAARDVRFAEDSSSSELAIVEVDAPPYDPGAINNLVDNALIKDMVAVLEVSYDVTPSIPDLSVAPVTQGDISPNPVEEDPAFSPTSPLPKSTKWDSLPKREPSSRPRKPSIRYGLFAIDDAIFLSTNHHLAFVAVANEPRTYDEALQSPYSKQWEQAIQSEYAQLKKLGVFEWVDELPKGKKAIGSRIVFKEKLDGHGNRVKFKARIVAKGFSQVPGEDFTETFSSVAKFNTLQIFLTLAAFMDYEIHQVDVVTAYLRGNLDEEIYMRVPDGVEKLGSGRFWLLKKALYGLKQAGRQWKKRLHEVLSKLGFIHAFADDCLYLKHENGKITLLVLVYVDDMAVAGPDGYRIISFKNALSKDFEITDLGELKFILGILVTCDRANRLIYLNQSAYIHQVLMRFDMQDTSPVATPLAVKHDLTLSNSPQTEAEKQTYRDYANGIHYLSLVGSLLYATQTRPDIQFAVSLVAQFGGNPGVAHLEAAKRILRYLKGTVNFNLVLGHRSRDTFDLVGWTDSSWAQDQDDRRSTSGFVFDIARSSISWSSKKQATVATSSVKAEYIASSNATKEAIWLHTLLTELDFPPATATIVHANNQGCIAHSRAKHIDIRHHFIHERVERGEVDLHYVSTKDMLADIFTKALPRETFIKFRTRLGVLPPQLTPC